MRFLNLLIQLLPIVLSCINPFEDELLYPEAEAEAEQSDRVDGRKGNKRKRKRRNAYGESTWGRMLLDEYAELKQPNSDESKLFRLRFRIPFYIFMTLLEWAKGWYYYSDSNQDGVRQHDALGIETIPLSLKVFVINITYFFTALS